MKTDKNMRNMGEIGNAKVEKGWGQEMVDRLGLSRWERGKCMAKMSK